jgi:DNA-binding transcriptional regulator GbsR (MarR family)
MKINPENVNETKKRIKELIPELEKQSCGELLINEMKEILEAIGGDEKLYKQYSDIYDDAADALMFAGIEAESCKCDPLRKHVPHNK